MPLSESNVYGGRRNVSPQAHVIMYSLQYTKFALFFRRSDSKKTLARLTVVDSKEIGNDRRINVLLLVTLRTTNKYYVHHQ